MLGGGGGLGVLFWFLGLWVGGWVWLWGGGGGGVWGEVVGDGWGFVVAALLLDHVEVCWGVGLGVGTLVYSVPEV